MSLISHMGSIFACGKHCCFVPSTNASFAERSEQAIIAKDLFNGTEEFCRSYFEDEYPYTWEIAGNYMVNNLWDVLKNIVVTKIQQQVLVSVQKALRNTEPTNLLMGVVVLVRGALVIMLIVIAVALEVRYLTAQ